MKKIIFSTLILVMVAAAHITSQAQIFKTQLRITVIDDLGNIQEGATVKLFTSEKDFKAEKNPILPETKLTNKKGIIIFKEIEAREYWVLAEKGDKNNWGGGIKTDPLMEKKVNKINIVID